jgi:hypothetical protein
VIHPLADTGDDIAQPWLACWLAECDQVGELRQRADAGDDHALQELAGLIGIEAVVRTLGVSDNQSPQRWFGEPAG